MSVKKDALPLNFYGANNDRNIRIIPALTEDSSVQLVSERFIVRVDNNLAFNVQGISERVFVYCDSYGESSDSDTKVVVFCATDTLFGVMELYVSRGEKKESISCLDLQFIHYARSSKDSPKLLVVDSQRVKPISDEDSKLNLKIEIFNETFYFERFAHCLLFKHKKLGVHLITWNKCQKLKPFKSSW